MDVLDVVDILYCLAWDEIAGQVAFCGQAHAKDFRWRFEFMPPIDRVYDVRPPVETAKSFARFDIAQEFADGDFAAECCLQSGSVIEGMWVNLELHLCLICSHGFILYCDF